MNRCRLRAVYLSGPEKIAPIAGRSVAVKYRWFIRLSADGNFGRIVKGPVTAYGFSVLAVSLATAVTYVVPPLHEAPTDLYFAAIAATAWLCGRGPAILAILISTLAVDYFIIPPVFSIMFDIADVTRFVIFGFVALLTCYLQDSYLRAAIRLREANNVLDWRVQERTADLARTNEQLRLEIHERQAAEAALVESEGEFKAGLG